MSLENAKKVLDKLRSYGLKCAIAGGYARDTFFGVEPKDVDIIVFGIADRAAAVQAALSVIPKPDALDRRFTERLGDEDLATEACRALLYDFRPQAPGTFSEGDLYVEGTYNVYHTKEDTDDQLVEVHKFNDGIDVLVYPPCETLFQALSLFDFNLNQFALVGPELIPEYLGDTSLRILEKTRLDPDEPRIAYVREKYAALKPLIDKAIDEGRLF